MITLYPDRTVIRVAEKPQFNPTTAITIAVDTAYVAAQQGRNINQGIYMMDNMVANGSSGEGTLELHTKCPVGSLIGFNTVPINGEGASGDQVIITGFTVSQGNVFTAAGQPRKQPSPNKEPDGSYWIGQALNTGSQTYQIQIKVTVGQLQPVSYFINWDPFITAQ
ncbi:AidA/PixA family protein [Microcystis aeruginosa]|jgi:hypothetical protein|uniref:AidA/PixA family protein n=1 Tax=Microcystis aeruginosa TaxID=1126 RepID=UPI00233062B2|nr:AidA/PixA family protein [Microcystis aeruginosa]MDB9433936.1 AidA/PixA family protein [Microcystis aeruginosa CS-552/01]